MDKRNNAVSQKEHLLERMDFWSFYRRMLPALRGNGGENAMAHCPFHDDNHPSLSVNIKNGLYNCFACGAKGDVFGFYMSFKNVDFNTAFKEIVAMTQTKLAGKRETGKVVATYDYHGLNGKTLYIKERIEPGRDCRSKEFRFKHPKHGGMVAWRGNEAVLYNLLALAGVEQVFVVEGEAKVDRLKDLGLTATCLDSGAMSPWKEKYLEAFKGKEQVVILPDNDDPGRNYAIRIARALSGTVKDIRIVELPGLGESEDIIDWLKVDGNDKHSLLEIVEAAPKCLSQTVVGFKEEGDTVDEELDDADEAPLMFPEGAWRGVFDTYRQAMKGATSASDVSHFITLWSVIGCKLHRKVKFTYGMDLYPNGQFVYYGETGDKKTTATTRSISMVTDDTHIKVLQGIGSGEGLTDWLGTNNPGSSNFLYLSELAELLKRGRWDNATLKTVLTTLYDCPPVYEVPFRKNSIKIIEPTLTILACTTPSLLWKDMTDLDIHSGFANRMLFLTGMPKEPIALPGEPDEALITKVREDIDEAIKALPYSPLTFRLDPSAETFWSEFYNEWNAKNYQQIIKAGIKRVDSYMLKLAMIYAVLEGTSPQITKDQLNAAIQVGEYAASCTERLILKHQWKSKTAVLEDRIIEELRKKNLTRRELQRKTASNCGSSLFNKTLEAMVIAHKIYEKKGGRANQLIYSLRAAK